MPPPSNSPEVALSKSSASSILVPLSSSKKALTTSEVPLSASSALDPQPSKKDLTNAMTALDCSQSTLNSTASKSVGLMTTPPPNPPGLALSKRSASSGVGAQLSMKASTTSVNGCPSSDVDAAHTYLVAAPEKSPITPIVMSTGTESKRLITVSNLHSGITSDDLNDVFERFGTLEKVVVHSGHCSGELVYASKIHAQNAKETYDGVRLDGVPMRITIGKLVRLPGTSKAMPPPSTAQLRESSKRANNRRSPSGKSPPTKKTASAH